MDFSLVLNKTYEKLTTDVARIEMIQQRFSELFAFENFDILNQTKTEITKEFLYDKLITNRRGGVCYELNGLLYLLLKQLDFPVSLGVATVWAPSGWIMDQTHTIIFWDRPDGTYVIDSGSGNNLALQPVKIDGNPVKSAAGTFRIRTKSTEKGTMLKEKLVDGKWLNRYAFYPDVVDWSDLERIRQLIQTHPDSPFLKGIMYACIHENHLISITEERLKITTPEGEETEIPFLNEAALLEAISTYGTSSIVQAAKVYLASK